MKKLRAPRVLLSTLESVSSVSLEQDSNLDHLVTSRCLEPASCHHYRGIFQSNYSPQTFDFSLPPCNATCEKDQITSYLCLSSEEKNHHCDKQSKSIGRVSNFPPSISCHHPLLLFDQHPILRETA